MIKLVWVVFAAVVAASVPARDGRANPEPGLYDARSLAMAGAGLTFIDNPSAIFHNPANLQGIETWAGTFVLTGLVANLGAPLDGPDDRATTGPQAAPTFLLGAGYRVHDRVVVAGGAYIYTGYGGDYNEIASILGTPLFDPADQEVALFVGEIALPVSVRIADDLDVGLGLRVPYARQEVQLHQEVLPGSYRPIRQSVAGWGAPGVLAGATWRLSEDTAVAAAYRSKVAVAMDGEVSVLLIAGGDEIVVPAETEWFVPHMARVGASTKLLDRRLFVTGELRVQFHADANDVQVFDLTPDGGDPPLPGFDEITAPLEWNNVYNVVVGAEYDTGLVAYRAGYTAGNSATSEAAAQFFNTPPGFLHGFNLGFGLDYAHYDFDVGVGVGHGRDDVDPQPGRCQPGDTIKVGCPGEYTVLSGMLGASVTYTP